MIELNRVYDMLQRAVVTQDETLKMAVNEILPTYAEGDREGCRFEDGKDDTTEVEDVEHWVPVRLFLVPVNGGKAGPLTGNHDVIDTFAVDRKGGRVLSRHLP